MSESNEINCLIISDTHGKVDRIREVINSFLKVVKKDSSKKLFFLGDKVKDILSIENLNEFSTYIVKGNCDVGCLYDNFGNEIKETEIIYVKDKKILLTHGHTFVAKSGDFLMINEAIKNDCDAVIFGHTHIARNEFFKAGTFPFQKKDLYLFNPGSLGEPIYGNPSFGTLTIKDNNVIFSNSEK